MKEIRMTVAEVAALPFDLRSYLRARFHQAERERLFQELKEANNANEDESQGREAT